MKRNKITTIVLLAVLFVGFSMVLYPTVANYWNKRHSAKLVVEYQNATDELTEAEKKEFFDRANSYNQKLASLKTPITDYRLIPDYQNILNVNKQGMMGYIFIDKIQVQLPIYHGTDSSILSFSCGHLEGTSFPVGGKNTHSSLSAHRGLSSAKLFTDLDRLEIGDTFQVVVLDKKLTYQVDQIKTVLPTNVNDLRMDKNEDYCTLVTCTPYGINTHRLLVRGVRITSKEQISVTVTSDAFEVDKLIVMSIVALPIILLLIVFVCVKPVKKNLPIEINQGEETL